MHLGREDHGQLVGQLVNILCSVIVEVLNVQRDRYAAARAGRDFRRAVYVCRDVKIGRDRVRHVFGYVARNQVPVELSKPLNEECTVYYTVWDYDAETVIREGEIHFDKYEQQKWIHVGDSDRNTLVEVSGIQNIGLGENSFHYRKAS